MTRKKSSEKKTAMQKAIANARLRLPSSRNTICEGCFNPRNTLTVKPHLNKIWHKDQIDVSAGEAFVKVPCQYCKETRKLSLSKFSKDVFESDYTEFSQFVLLKDAKYNAFVGVTTVVDLGELIDG